MFERFQRTLVVNYIIGSGLAVFGVGGVFIFQTLDLSIREVLLLLTIMLGSGVIMVTSELLLYRRHIHPIRQFFSTESPTTDELTSAFEQASRFPILTVKRILGPHLFGLSIPSITLTTICMYYSWIDLPYRLIGLAAIGAVMIAVLHALIEYFLTVRAIEPLLVYMKNRHDELYGQPIQTVYRSFSVRTKLMISMLITGVFPIMLFMLASSVQLSTSTRTDTYWNWAFVILVIIIGIAVLCSFLLYDNIKRPIGFLTSGIEQIEAGQLQKIENPYLDEFAQLIGGFNQMVETVNAREQENAQLLDSLFILFAATLDARDPYTAGHSERVAMYSVELARAIDLPQTQIDLLNKSALLHDIGKIGIRDDVLLKEGKLTDEEFAKIQEHPTIGIHILSQIHLPASLQPILAGVRSHHERIDGRGYPDRLRETDIPLFGRIMAIADAYDAMTSDRPYRSGMPVEKALSILESGRGTQWDAEYVDVFVKLRRQAISA
ncbi:HD domain-containing phosphohydrolase [Exiguobacterium qingdaonense]|uniref:HD domain-containing phosphohydrolase n=1 Tax=Exiguobacterium qingdaonense TaxID=2751251 RepID=UPI001BEB02F8|nr:HD domain-containing phosphohydrolase [Exiguobacterium qingdaonense]